MTIGAILSWMLCGLLVGLTVRVLMPGRLEVGLLWAMVLGIIGAVVGGLLYSFVQGVPSDPFSFTGNAWHGWIVAILGGILVLFVWGAVYPKSWWS